MSVLGK